MSSQLRLSDLIPELPLKLKAARVVEGYLTGIHDSPFHGFSAEFSQHRQYQHGDDLRHFDWKVWARNEKLFIRQYEEETNLSATLILDCSASMGLSDGSFSKWDYSSVLAASLIHFLLRQRDGTGVIIANETVQSEQIPKSAAWIEPVLFNMIENQKAGGKTSLRQALQFLSSKNQRRGLVIVISDFFDDPDQFIPAFRQLSSQGHDIIAIQVLNDNESQLDAKNDVWTVDSETGERMETHWVQLADSYQTAFTTWQTELAALFRNTGVEWYPVRTSDPFAIAIRKVISHRQK